MKVGFIQCPYCANEIKEGAIKCQYCKEFLKGENNSQNLDINKKDNGKKGIKSKLWRTIIVIYFILTIPIFLFIRWGVTIEAPAPSYYLGTPRDRGNTILGFILTPIVYIIITDILRGAIYYIDSGKYQLAIRNKIRSLF